MRLYLIRHTRVAVPAGLCYGHLDVPLADSFATEADAVRGALPAGIARAWSSPSTRCHLLAERLAPKVQTDERLRELAFGEWEGKTWAELDSPEARHWGNHWQTARPPGGESLPQLLCRLRAFLSELPQGDHVIVCHAGPIRALLHILAGIPLATAFQQPIGFGDVLCLPLRNLVAGPPHPS